jgi:phage tail tube protein FII
LIAARIGPRLAHNQRGATNVNAPLKDEQLLTIVKNVVEQNGCQLIDIDFENHILNIEGSDEAQARCALALEEVLG